ncbi:hypothetical protein FE392_00525 [Xenorhabdus sp. 12]|uniref:Uncharacterized protein n=1 Tax=Xenorhabdus santafensis TaxID=2582833 RepID=A0ABU4S404_9GAMM|nr:hypothetical protein [Xenorhabdus sp. 12]MDX7985832.1 hypothetical protein [Xenorhabdus sp. 12]
MGLVKMLFGQCSEEYFVTSNVVTYTYLASVRCPFIPFVFQVVALLAALIHPGHRFYKITVIYASGDAFHRNSVFAAAMQLEIHWV